MEILGASDYDFYRCSRCNAIFTFEQERKWISQMQFGGRRYIHCNSLRYEPGLPHAFEWLKPSVFKYAFKAIMARTVAPWAGARGMVWLQRLARRLAA